MKRLLAERPLAFAIGIGLFLVLLGLFVLAATGVGLVAFVRPAQIENQAETEKPRPLVNTPEAEVGVVANKPESLRIDIAIDPEGTPVYAVAVGDNEPEPNEKDLHSLTAALALLKVRVNKAPGPVEVVINCDKELPARVARDVLLALQAEPFRQKVRARFFGVTNKRPANKDEGPASAKNGKARPGSDETELAQPRLSRPVLPAVTSSRTPLIRVVARQHEGRLVISIKGKEVKEKELKLALERYVRDGRDELLLETDGISHSTLVEIMDAAKAANVKRIQFLHEKKP
jgi:biopolymer transport protein ExbD